MLMVAKSGAPPSSSRRSSASDSTPPIGQREVNSGHVMEISYSRSGYGLGKDSSSSGRGMEGRRQALIVRHGAAPRTLRGSTGIFSPERAIRAGRDRL